jgi:mRNA interferase MazF
VTEHGDRSRFIDEAVHHYIQKTRPSLIIQHDIANRHSPITIEAASTSQFGETMYPTAVLIQPPAGGSTIPSVVHGNRIRSIDTRRLVHRLGARALATRDRIDRAVLISLRLVEI